MFVRYSTPRGTIHDLEHLNTLSADCNRALLVSERTLYLLQNFAALDLTFRKRYAAELGEHGYFTAEPGTESYNLMLDVIGQAEYEIWDMSSEIGDGLQAIAAAIATLVNQPGDTIQVFGGGDGCSLPNVVVNCVVNIPNDQLLPPADQEFPPYIGDPPEGFETWAEYLVYKCQAAEFIWDLERKWMVALRNLDLVYLTAAVVGPVAAGLLGILPTVFTPGGFVVFVTSVVAIGVTSAWAWWYMDQMISYWDSHKDDIVCSLYNSGTSPAAVTALSGWLEDAIQAIVSWGVLAPLAGEIAGLLATAFAQLAGNGAVEPLFKLVVAATQFEYDCADCEDPECNCELSGYPLYGTGSIIPNGEQRTWYGEALGSDSAIYIDLPCNRRFTVVAVRNCVDWGGVFAVFRSMAIYGDCQWPTELSNPLYYCTQLPDTTGTAARFVFDSQGTASTPIEVDIIIWPD